MKKVAINFIMAATLSGCSTLSSVLPAKVVEIPVIKPCLKAPVPRPVYSFGQHTGPVALGLRSSDPATRNSAAAEAVRALAMDKAKAIEYSEKLLDQMSGCDYMPTQTKPAQ